MTKDIVERLDQAIKKPLRYTGAKMSEMMLDEVFCNKERIKGVKVGL